MGELLEFVIPRKLAKGERPRTDADRIRDLREIEGEIAMKLSGLVDFAKSGEPKGAA